jgi:hypothetical protein
MQQVADSLESTLSEMPSSIIKCNREDRPPRPQDNSTTSTDVRNGSLGQLTSDLLTVLRHEAAAAEMAEYTDGKYNEYLSWLKRLASTDMEGATPSEAARVDAQMRLLLKMIDQTRAKLDSNKKEEEKWAIWREKFERMVARAVGGIAMGELGGEGTGRQRGS